MDTFIFPIKDIDEVFINVLSLIDLLQLAQVNKYYNAITTTNVLVKEYKVYLANRDLKLSSFTDMCKNGLINLAKWKKYSYNIDIHENNDSPFIYSCSEGHLDVAKWLHSIGVDIHTQYGRAFVFSCEDGHLDVAKWLYNKGGIDIDEINEVYYLFPYCCGNGDLDVVKWLYSIGSDIYQFDEIYNYNGLMHASKNNHLIISKWLFFTAYAKDGVNNEFNKYINSYLVNNIYYGNLEIVKWLYFISKDEKYICNRNHDNYHIYDAFMDACRYKKLDIAKWFVSIWNTMQTNQ